MNYLQLFKETIKATDLLVSNQEIESLISYVKAIISYNKKVNILGTNELKEILYKHVIDCLLGCSFLPRKIKTVADIGSGAGFPGIPLAILNKHIDFYLVESKSKKARFLEEVKKELNLLNVFVVNKNVNEVSNKFDCITSRAFSSISKLLKLTSKMKELNTIFFLFKGKEEVCLKEIEEAKINLKSIVFYRIKNPFDEGERNILRFNDNVKKKSKFKVSKINEK